MSRQETVHKNGQTEPTSAVTLSDVEFRRRGRVILTDVNLTIRRGGCCSVPTASANPRW